MNLFRDNMPKSNVNRELLAPCTYQKSYALHINSSSRTNPAHFSEKILRIHGFEKHSFFESAISDFFFQNPMKSSQRFLGSKDGSKFLCLPWFPAHEDCKLLQSCYHVSKLFLMTISLNLT